MTLNIETIKIQLASEHLVLLGLVVWAMVPKVGRLLRKKK
jgi:hypothetical protein